MTDAARPMTFDVRPYHPSDVTSLVRICLLTGASGDDASPLYKDPDLLGLYFAAPYVAFEPELCFVLTCDHVPCGYVLGTRDSAAFAARCERDWFPALRQRYVLPPLTDKSPDAWVIRMIHAGPGLADSTPGRYPAHLHIDILPHGQRRGWGRALIDRFARQLGSAGVPGMHLRVGKSNRRAIGFYDHLGFQCLGQTENTLLYGRCT